MNPVVASRAPGGSCAGRPCPQTPTMPDSPTAAPLTIDAGSDQPGVWTLRLTGVTPASGVDPRDTNDPPEGLIGRGVPATVPGCVHTDLLAAGLIPDPEIALHEDEILWIGRSDAEYSRTLRLPAEALEREHLELCFDGLDTLAEVSLNGEVVGSSANMHTRQRFDAKAAARVGDNELVVRFAAPLPAALAAREQNGWLPSEGAGANPKMPHAFLRKMSCNMGWDWGPTVTTSGIWRACRVEAWDACRLGDVRMGTRSLDGAAAEVVLTAAVQGEGTARFTLISPGGREVASAEAVARGGAASGGGEASATARVEDAELWWPVGHGAQPLHTLRVELVDADGVARGSREVRVGVRTTELVTDEDPADAAFPVDGLAGSEGVPGRRMTLRINGKDVYCKGANWIPEDLFPHRTTRDTCRQRVAQAVDMNMNMLRVWGGGLYESEDLYEACDQAGVMVWQDFLFACAAYPEGDAYVKNVEAEARDNVARLGRHPALVLWNGCNENLWGWYDWTANGKPWKDEIGEKPWGPKHYFETLPAVVAGLAPETPYWPGSPSSGFTFEEFKDESLHPNMNSRGNRHVWNVWHGPGHYQHYYEHFPRFCSEFGFHAPNAWPSLLRSTPEDQRDWTGPVLRQHNKNGHDVELGDGQNKTATRVHDDFPVPAGENLDDFHHLASVNQARAVTAGVGWFRSLFPWNSGALYWQINDCWPGASWSSVDTDGIPKPLYHATRRFFAPRVVNLGPARPTELHGWGDDAGPLRAYLHNDSDERWAGELTVRLLEADGSVVEAQTDAVDLEPRSSAGVDVRLPALDPAAHPGRFLVAELPGGVRSFWWSAPDREAGLPDPEMRVEVGPGGRSVTVHAQTLLRDLTLYVERLHPEARVDDAAVTLLPGESHTFAVSSPVDLDAAALSSAPVLRTSSELARGQAGWTPAEIQTPHPR